MGRCLIHFAHVDDSSEESNQTRRWLNTGDSAWPYLRFQVRRYRQLLTKFNYILPGSSRFFAIFRISVARNQVRFSCRGRGAGPVPGKSAPTPYREYRWTLDARDRMLHTKRYLRYCRWNLKTRDPNRFPLSSASDRRKGQAVNDVER